MQTEMQAEDVFAKIPQSVIANFHTHLTEYTLDEHTEIDISTQLDEQALDKIVKQLLTSTLDQQTLDKLNFDFLVNGKLLRGKLKSHLVRYEVSGQNVQVEYFLAWRDFEKMQETPAQDWVSAICEVIGEQNNIGVVASLFNGTVAYYDQPTKDTKKKATIHSAPIKAVKCLPSEKENIYYVVSGSIDEQLKVSKMGQNIQVISVNEHQGSVLAIDFNPSLDGHICSAGYSGALNIWKIPQNFIDDQNNEVKTEKKKKKKTNLKNLPQLASENIHKGSINSVCWLNGTTVATGSSDHSIKLTDIQKMNEIRNFLTRDSITTGIDFSNNTLFSSHQDGYIRTWDCRTQNSSPIQTFKSHSRFASCVKSQAHSLIFATGSYDQTVKIWDRRSVFPLQTIATNYDKVFALCWKSDKQLISGGSNPFLTFHHV